MSDEVFADWRGRNLDDVLGLCCELVDEADYSAVTRWRERGGKVVGHFQVYFPEELAHAAGLLPVKILGAPIEAMQGESRFGSYLCSILKTSLELHLSGRLDLDAFVSHPICDAARNLAAVWSRNAAYPCQILYLPQNANSAHSLDYLQAEYERLLGDLESIAGVEVSEDDLVRSIQLFDRNRELLRRLYAVKRDTPWQIAAEEAYSLVALAGRIPREEHNELLTWVLDELPSRGARPRDRIRVVFEGGFCEQPPLDLVRLIGRSCYLVDDDLLIGLRWITSDVGGNGTAPVRALAEAYLERSSYSPVQHDLRKPKEKMLLERIDTARADAAILAAAKMCEPGLEEQVAYTRALDDADIPFFVTEFQESMSSFEHLELQLETFAENLLFD
ncbi:MAG: 2-hydroxyacyl-CoA dehydratase [Thermoanaerobaculia bacterium]|nr:2-hydroxyacyl-CoA dehydratase [Thermoanaerobaculia bacterium]